MPISRSGAPRSREFALCFEAAAQERSLGRCDVAAAILRVVLQQCPEYPQGWSELSSALADLPQEAAPANHKPVAADYSKAVQIADRAQQDGDYEKAVALYRVVLAQAPGYVDGHAKLARALFCLRRWDEAWRAFDVRFKLMDAPPTVNARDSDGAPRHLPRCVEAPPPKNLLVLCEQGMGDTIQFARFLPRLVEAGVRLQAVVPQRLFGLLRTLDPPPPCLPAEQQSSLTGVENWTTMMDLPLLLGLGEADYMAHEPYLRADPVRVARWRGWLEAQHGARSGPTIAFCWRGNPEHKLDGSRSATLADLAPLAEIPGATLICLQHNVTDEDLAACGFGEKIVRPGPDFDAGIDAFLDSAALLTLVDRMVCVDTSLAHVAGALHCRVEMMIAHEWSDWRWIDNPDFNVWYPTLRIWRRDPGGSYRDVAARIAHDLTASQ